MASIREIILRVTSESQDAKDDLAELGGELDALDRADAEAVVDVDISAADRALSEIRADLARFAKETAEASAGIDTGAAREQLDALEVKLRSFSGETYTADVDVAIAGALANIAIVREQLGTLDRDFGGAGTKGIDQWGAASARAAKSVAGLAGDVERLDTRMNGVNQRGNIFTRTLARLRTGLSNSAKDAGKLFGRFGDMLGMVTRLGPVVADLASGGIALAASFGKALLGAGALAIGLGSTLIPAILLGVGAIRHYKEESTKAGTAAHSLKNALTDLGKTFDNVTQSGVDKIFTALANVLPDIGRALRSLRPDFTELGGAVAHAISQFADFATSERTIHAVHVAFQTLADLIRGPGTDALISFAKILVNIGEAAGPLVVKEFQAVADWLAKIASHTSDIKDLRDTIKGQVDTLNRWVDLLGHLGGIIVGVFRAALPDGQKLTRTLDQGARALDHWVNSASGQNKIRQFFDDVIPVASQVVELAGKLLVAFLKWTQLTAPTMRVIFRLLNAVADAVNGVLDAIDKLPGPLKDIAGGLLLLGGGKILGAIRGLAVLLAGRLLSAIGRVAAAIAARLIPAVMALATRALPALIAVAPEVFAATVVILAGVVAVYEGMKVGGKLADLWKSKLIDSTKMDEATANLKDFADSVVVMTGATRHEFHNIADAAQSMVSSIVKSLKDGGPKAKQTASDLAHGALAAIHALTGNFSQAGKDLIDALTGGIDSKQGKAKNAGDGIGRAAKEAAAAFSAGFHDVGEDHGDRYAGGLAGKDGPAKNAGNAVARAAKQAIADLSPDFNDQGSEHGDRYIGGLTGKQKGAGNAGTGLGNAAKTGMGTPDYRSVGNDAGAAFAAGLKDAQRALEATAAAVGAAIGAAMSQAAQNNYHPPSGGGGHRSKVADAAPTGKVAAAGAGAGGGGVGVVNVAVSSPAGTAPDARHLAAQLSLLMRNRGFG